MAQTSEGATARSEQALLGSLLIDGAVLDLVAETVAPEDFTGPTLRRIYGAMLALRDRGIGVDYVTVCHELDAERAKVPDYQVTALINLCPTSLHALHYAQVVAEAATDRREQDRRERLTREFPGAVQV